MVEMLAPRPTSKMEGQVLYSSDPSPETSSAGLDLSGTEVPAGLASSRVIRTCKPQGKERHTGRFQM